MRRKKKIKILKVRKRYILLLEVLIAFMLVALCVFPLISPHTYILIAQRKFIDKIEVDHLVNVMYADIVERMYENKIPLNDIINSRTFEIDDTYLEQFGIKKAFPYRGTYQFGIPKSKYKPRYEAPYTVYLLPLDFTFFPKGQENAEEGKETLKYHYEVFAIRDLTEGELPPGEEETESEEEEVE